MSLNIENIISEIRNTRQYRYQPDVYLMEKGVSLKDWLPIITTLYDKYEKDYISDIIDQLALQASTEIGYIEFLSYVVSKNPDLVNCPFKILTEIDSSLSLGIYNIIKNSSSPDLRFVSGILLYYLVRKYPGLNYEEIKKSKQNMDLATRTALVMSLQDVPPWRDDTVEVPQYVKDFIIECSTFEDERLRRLTVRTGIIRYDLDKNNFRPFIESFVDESEINKISVLQVIEPNNCPDPEFDLSLIERCSNTDSLNVISWLLRIIGGKLLLSEIDKQRLIDHSLQMIRKWSTINGFSQLGIQFMVETIGKLDVERAMKFIEKWIPEETNHIILQFVLPKIIYELYHDKETELFQRISTWQNERNYTNVWFFTIEKILKEIDHFTNHKFNLADIHITKSLSFAEQVGATIDSIKESNSDKSIIVRVNQTLSFLQRLRVMEREKDKFNLLKSHKHDLSTFIDSYQNKSKAVNLIYDSLMEIARKSNFSLSQVNKMYDKSLSSKVVKCVALIEEIHKEKKSIDSNVVQANLMLFPNMSSYLGHDWFKKTCSDVNTSHDLIDLLSLEDLTDSILGEKVVEFSGENDPVKRLALMRKIKRILHIRIRLDHIDSCLGIIGKMQHGKKSIIRRLKNEDEYHQTLSELEVGSVLKKKYSVSLQEPIGDRPVDILAISAQNQKLILEVTSLDTLAKLKYMKFVPNIKNKVRSVILEKIEKQLHHFPSADMPIILVIDKSRAHEIEVDDVVSALYGSIGVEIITNKDNLDEPHTYKPVRLQDSINHTSELARKMSAVIIYESATMISQDRVKLVGQIIPNPNASVLLNEKELNDITQCLFE